jgi:hypothetical protein
MYETLESELSALALAPDRRAWRAARRAVDAGLARLRAQVVAAYVAGDDDAPARYDRLAAAAAAIAPPRCDAPALACADALLAALSGGDAARRVAAVIRTRTTTEDLAGLLAILREHDDHALARGFARFSEVRRRALVALLGDPEIRALARARSRGTTHDRSPACRGTA